MLRGAGIRRVHARKGCFQAAHDAVHHRGKGECQQFLTAREIVADRTHSQPCFVRRFPEGGPFQPVSGDDAENCFNNVLAPGFGIYDFWHSSYLARMCSLGTVAVPCRARGLLSPLSGTCAALPGIRNAAAAAGVRGIALEA